MRYDKYDAGYTQEMADIKGLLLEGEQLLWSGKPKKNAFVINKCVVMMPIALIWFSFDAFFIGNLIST